MDTAQEETRAVEETEVVVKDVGVGDEVEGEGIISVLFSNFPILTRPLDGFEKLTAKLVQQLHGLLVTSVVARLHIADHVHELFGITQGHAKTSRRSSEDDVMLYPDTTGWTQYSIVYHYLLAAERTNSDASEKIRIHFCILHISSIVPKKFELQKHYYTRKGFYISNSYFRNSPERHFRT